MQEISSPLTTKFIDIEKEINKNIGSKVFDYLGILSPEIDISIDLSNLSIEKQNLLIKYIKLAQDVLKELSIDFKLTKQSLADQFFEVMHEIYLLRYIQAKISFAQYFLVRVPTKEEKALTDAMTEKPDRTETFSISLPDYCLKLDKHNNIDITATKELEAKRHYIATNLSIITEIEEISSELLEDFGEITEKGFIPEFFEDELLDINDEISQICLQYFTQEAYTMMDKGQGIDEIIENSISFYNKIILPPSIKFPEKLKTLSETISKSIVSFLNEIKNLNESTKKTFLQEYTELILLYIKEGRFFARNYYSLNFFKEENSEQSIETDTFYIDMFWLKQDLNLSPFPVERYRFDLTEASKSFIFKFMTNNIINPYFTLKDYLKV